MHLDAAQQELYARHLLLDGFGGEAQERLLAASVRVRGGGVAARWAARYLAASGVGRLSVEVEAWHPELLALGPWLSIDTLSIEPTQLADGEVSPAEAESPAASALNGALSALQAVRAIAQGQAR